MPRIRKLEIVAEGIQRNGQPVDSKVLESVVRNYNPDARPPVTQGHPEKGADQIKALGRIAVMGVGKNSNGKSVLLCEQHYTPELEKLEDDGYLEGQSVGIYPHPGKDGEYYLHHVAQLGQLPPAADIKTQDVTQLSNEGSEKAVYLFADVGKLNPQHKNDEDIMDIKKLIEAVKDKSSDKTKPNGDEGDKDKPNDDKGVTAMQETLADDRRERLTELADTRNIPEDSRIRTMIKNAGTIELCATGDDSRFGDIKALIEDMPEAPSNNHLFGDLELSDSKANGGKTVEIEGF